MHMKSIGIKCKDLISQLILWASMMAHKKVNKLYCSFAYRKEKNHDHGV